MLVPVFVIISLLVLLPLIIALFTRKEYRIEREIEIKAPEEEVFTYIKQLKNQDNFNKWVMTDPDMKREFKGTDGEVGFIYGWNGNKKAGEGELEIVSIEENKSVDHEIRFVRPFTSIAQARMTTEFQGQNRTRVTWSNESELKYPMNLMVSMIEKMLAKDMDASLLNLKNILEKE